jgi:hypothetical protein
MNIFNTKSLFVASTFNNFGLQIRQLLSSGLQILQIRNDKILQIRNDKNDKNFFFKKRQYYHKDTNVPPLTFDLLGQAKS